MSVLEMSVSVRDLPAVKALVKALQAQVARAWADGYGLGRDDEADGLELRPNPFAADAESPK